MFQRSILQELRKWRVNPSRKPLFLMGARQVGKTTLVQQFAEEFQQYIYLNLVDFNDQKPFEDFSGFENMLRALFFIKGKSLADRANTLIFIDEIQKMPIVLTYLQNFCEEAPDISVIAAGALQEHLFPVRIKYNLPAGYVDFLTVQPASFLEFLEATGQTEAIQQLMIVPEEKSTYDPLRRLFRTYCLIGGMPEIVAHYAANKDLTALGPIYESILTSYLGDVALYALSNSQMRYIRFALRASFGQAGSRIKFQYFGYSSYKSREMGEALRALEKAQLIRLIYPQTSTVLPLSPDITKSPQLQVLDSGMLNYFLDLQKEIIGNADLNYIHLGIMVKHVVGQELLALQNNPLHELPFWVREKTTSSAEVNYLFPFKGKLIPMEVKSGAAGSLRSLVQFMDEAPHTMAVRFYTGKLQISTFTTPSGKTVHLLNLPFHSVSQIEKYLEWFETQIMNQKLDISTP